MSVRPGINADFLAADLDLAAMAARFTRDDRDVWRHRDAVLTAFGARRGERVLDLGAGTGAFAVVLARTVGADGTVHALDLAPPFVLALAELARREGLPQLRAGACTPTGTGLPTDSLDRALVCDTYHHLEYPQAMLADLRRVLRPGGELFVVDFDKIPGTSREWILGHVRADRAQATAEITAAGFALVETCECGLEENYALRFVRGA
ncbi:MAG: hypothetical protein RL398_1856 [Planctomycetota bacterium]|jgi:ubiquinone/menaquinone biosynthesis C-methylase UbiE